MSLKHCVLLYRLSITFTVVTVGLGSESYTVHAAHRARYTQCMLHEPVCAINRV